MPRYVIRATVRADGWPDPPSPQTLPHPLVYPSEPMKTGLLDQHGNAIYRLPDEVGFLPGMQKDSRT
jgi:hypothetical protein